MPTRRLPRVLGALFLGVASLALPVRRAQGFDTVPKDVPNDGQVHDGIITEALDGLASPERIKTLIWAAARNDDPTGERFGDERRHFDSNKIDKSLEWVLGRMETAIADGALADKEERKLQSSLEALGDLLHSVQDFYSHSNYIELTLKAGVDPEKIEPIDWAKRPAGLKTGYYCNGENGIWARVTTRQACIDEIHKGIFDTEFATDRQKAELAGDADSYDGAIAFATSKYDFLHYDINKDNSRKPMGRIVHPGSKLTLFEIARRVAVKETRRQWKILLDGLRKESGERASAVTSAVSGMKIEAPAGDGFEATIQEHPVKKSGNFWSWRHEKTGKKLIVHLVQDPASNPFDKEHPELCKDLGMLAEMCTDYASALKAAEEDCERWRKTGR
jgi:hypothetical protein